jgi:serine phosphatase RsbU (regulator of sigma subunit)
MPDGRLGILLADASGHGIAPALVVMQARTLVRTLSDTETNPLKLMVRINGRLAEDMVPGRFVTVFLGFLSQDGTLDWASGGHSPILIRRTPSGPLESLEPALPPIGILTELFDDPSPSMKIEPGGSLIVTSDGITESFSPEPEEELYGQDRLVALLDQCERSEACLTSTQIIDTIHKEMIHWQGGRDEAKDDQTVVVIRRVE